MYVTNEKWAKLKGPFQSVTGERIYEMVGSGNKVGRTVGHSIALVEIPSGKSSPAHFHKKSEETYYVLGGKGRMIIDGEERILEPGQMCPILPGQIHQIFTEGEEDLRFLVVCAPAWRPDDTYEPPKPSDKKSHSMTPC